MQMQIDHRNPSKIITGYQFGNYYRLDVTRKRIVLKHKLGFYKIQLANTCITITS